MKQKKIEKLRGNELPKIHLDDYEDSSDFSGSSSQSDAEEDVRGPNAQIYQAGLEMKYSGLDLIMDRNILINTNMYENFLGALLETDDERMVLATLPQDQRMMKK